MKDNFFLALRNCSNFTDEQVRAVAFVRGITAAVCCFLLFAVLVIIFILAKRDYQKVCGTVVKRLAVGFTVAMQCTSTTHPGTKSQAPFQS